MGYDEPASKRPAGGLAPGLELAPVRRKRWPVRMALLLGALLIGGYFASQTNSDDPIAGLTTLVSDPMKVINSVIGGGDTQQAGGRGRAARNGGNAPPVRVAQATSQDVPVTVHT